MDKHGNTQAKEGVDRCPCGAKYWENDRCVSCDEPWRAEDHTPVAVMELDKPTFDHVLAMTNKLGGTNVKPGPLPDYVLRAMRGEEDA
jgi:hypothetical protein